MDRALELAGLGWGRVAPNPLVGAVLLRDGVVLGEGYHGEFGGPHAETVALSQVSDPVGATCVVTLEPCAHHGKTPPCVDALIRAGVARVVIAVPDPHPKASGGAAKLRGAGIDVEMGLGREDAYKIVQRNSARTWEEDVDFTRLLAEDPDVTAKLDRTELEELFDYRYYVRHVDEVFERAGLS